MLRLPYRNGDLRLYGYPNVYTFAYASHMRIETLSVREAREQLPSLLERFRSGDRRAVFLGAHRRTEAVMLPIEVYDELLYRRRKSVDQAWASVRAEGLEPSNEVEYIVEQWVHGHITAEEMERRVAAHYGIRE